MQDLISLWTSGLAFYIKFLIIVIFGMMVFSRPNQQHGCLCKKSQHDRRSILLFNKNKEHYAYCCLDDPYNFCTFSIYLLFYFIKWMILCIYSASIQMTTPENPSKTRTIIVFIGIHLITASKAAMITVEFT